MTTERAVNLLKYGCRMPDFCDAFSDIDEACEIACHAIQENIERENPKPLTLDELRQMNGQPVYVQKDAFLESCYGIVCITYNQEYVMSFIPVHQGYAMLKVHFSEYGESWVAYKYKPMEV